MNCNYIRYDSENVCGSSHGLNFVYFRDPENTKNSHEIALCQVHSDIVLGLFLETIKKLQLQKASLFARANRERVMARQNDAYYDFKTAQSRIDDLKRVIHDIEFNRCRAITCNANLKTLRGKVYSATAFGFNGRWRHTFYFCSLKCWNTMRGECGIKLPIHQGQFSLEQAV